ncbi:hypothetical protein Ddye_010208 [Dipteronia dyeriana]|uniref:RNA helicase n=1 Tax=Dipteronia dyeriana TaxID=168575 RepID=A0AAD9XDE9_9ROSI|nr:hypothetical protein Ddye_010208 [Dipteronia dyeriana]
MAEERVISKKQRDYGSERWCDQQESEEIEKNTRECECDAAATRKRKLMEPRLSPSISQEKKNEIEYLRKVSRQKYLKKREAKKMEEKRVEIEEGNQKSRLDKEIYHLINKWTTKVDDTKYYRMPEAYDPKQVYQHYSQESAAAEEKQQDWEGHQMGKATLTYGSKNKKQRSDDYRFIFDFSVNNLDQQLPSDMLIEDKSRQKSAFEMLQEDRKTLPIYPYHHSLLQAIEDYQVLVIVGETGSGKTTQIPQYLHEAGYTKQGLKIGCTQPRRVAAMSVATRVSQEMGVKLGHEVGYSIRFEDHTSAHTVIKYMTDGMLRREIINEPNLASYSVLMVDEAHERTLSTDILLGLLKDLIKSRPNLKLIISSATLDAVKFSDYFDSAPIFKIPGRKYPVEIHYTTTPEVDYIDAAIVTALQIHVTQPPGDILVFLTGQQEIETAEEILKHRMRGLGTKIAELITCPIYTNLPAQLQTKIFDPVPDGARKVVLATNIAETSLTIDGIKYVIDSGFAKVKSYNPKTGMESLLVNSICKASALQRAGRAGRTGPGKCFRIYTSYNFDKDMDDNIVPEIQRTNLGNVVLILKSLGIDDLANFDFIDPPPVESLIKALERLGHVGTGHGSHESRSTLSLLAAVSQLSSELEHGITLHTQQLKPEMKTASVQQQKLASSSKAVKLPVGTGFSDQDFHPYDQTEASDGFGLQNTMTTAGEECPPLQVFVPGILFCSCDGLLALYNPKLGIALLNIATRKHRVLPQFWSDFDSFLKFYDGFGDDSASDAYKLVRIVSSGESLIEVIVYNLRDNALRKIDVDFSYFLEIAHGFGTFVRGALNWLVGGIDSDFF